MLRIGKLTDYATVILATLASDRTRLQNASSLAERTHIAAPTVAKLLKQLHRAGLVISTRGTHGGYQLARDPQDGRRRICFPGRADGADELVAPRLKRELRPGKMCFSV
jgi:hypothetical protein